MKTERHALAALLLLAASAAPALAEPPTLQRPKEGEKFNDNVFITVARTNAPQCADGEWQIEWQVLPAGAKGEAWQPWKYALAGVSCYVKERSAIDMPRDLFDPAPARYRVRVRLTWKGGEGEWSAWRGFEVIYPKGAKPPARD
jgi:hypothetical protein